ncbi:hypothetical protein PV08_10306 [Exophiala spinifera]|uniref:UDENN FLCN/SMCR8-type domain-containing protein n=1 Tax=Exophiala spinifera TaxID=91928 RepID=A0A0D1ZDI3_9EURO|nr:uncharacterized protein PV08_10306 [Exophiala spinifera]KIW11007.1 hypothetical protein PV08_10306 [Exophiala spinifera]
MDFTLALTHFCEAHGPKSVLCTQVLPVQCALCLPPSPSLRACSSSDSLTTQVHETSFESTQNGQRSPILQKTETNLTLPTDFSGASTSVDSETEPESPTIEKHPLFRQNRDGSLQWPYGRAEGDTCASCSFSVPKAVAEKLPAGAPGSRISEGKKPASAPVLRSREFVCLRKRKRRPSNDYHDTRPSSYNSSFASSQSPAQSIPHSHSDDCHDHTLTYLTAKSPDDRESYAQLRASVIRTLSCELLPRGMSDGPFCFGDSNTGYTIAYVFRLTDPRARGRRRAYAFVALAGKDASRAFQACPMLWEAFASMAKGIEAAAQRHQEEQQRKVEEQARLADSNSSRNYTPVSSFLTSRTIDPDGHPRRGGQASPRSLAEIVGDENIFAYLHQYFVAILRCLGDQFGGLPLAETPSVYQSVSDESPRFAKSSAMKSRAPPVSFAHLDSLRDEDATPTPQSRSHIETNNPWQNKPNVATKSTMDQDDDVEISKTRANKAFKLNPPCAPLLVSETAQRQVVV